MNEQQVMQEFKDASAILSGHFILSSGLHSPTYLQCARVMMDAARGERLCNTLAAKIRSMGFEVDVVVALRRGFGLEKNQRVLICEDVVTTGKSSMEAVACVEEHGGIAVAVASLIDRRGSNDTSLTLPLVSLLKLDVPTYKPEALPPELQRIPAIKPGSRFLKGAV